MRVPVGLADRRGQLEHDLGAAAEVESDDVG